MRITRIAALAAATLAVLCSGCVVLPPAVPQTSAQPPAPEPTLPSTSAPVPSQTASPTPSPTPTPTSTPAGNAVQDGVCAPELLDGTLLDYDPATVQPVFAPAGVLDGLQLGCAATTAVVIDPDLSTHSLALVPAGDGVLEDLDRRILGSGLLPDPLVLGIYQDAAANPVAFVSTLQEHLGLNDDIPAFADADGWVIVIWYARR